MMFQVQDTETGAVHGEYPDGAKAGAAAKDLNNAFRERGEDTRVRVVRVSETVRMVAAQGSPVPRTFHIEPCACCRAWKVPITGVDWRKRELAKIQRAVPWFDADWWYDSEYYTMHYPYPSEAEPSMVAFTPSEGWGHEDRQLRMRPGKYLSRYFSDVLSEAQIQQYALAWDGVFSVPELEFAHTPDEIADVYRGGPNSCMSYDFNNLPMHPCATYGAGDLAVAYIRNGSNGITGRTVVWPEHKIYVCIYGDIDRMLAALDAAGYTQGSIVGARLLREPYGREFVAPYLDGDCDSLRDDGEYLIVDWDGPLHARETNGTAEPTMQCSHCDESVHEEDAVGGPDGNPYCPDCHSDLFVACDDCGEENERGHMHTGPDDWERCSECHADTVAMCDECQDDFMLDDLTEGLCEACAEEAEDSEDGIPLRRPYMSADLAQQRMVI
jgi:hypothetical protein